jgi:hypothetical protein
MTISSEYTRFIILNLAYRIKRKGETEDFGIKKSKDKSKNIKVMGHHKLHLQYTVFLREKKIPSH